MAEQDTRQALRQQILKQRDKLTTATRATAGKRILQGLWQIPAMKEATTIMLYVNFRSEVETMPLFSQCQQQDILTAAPLTISKNHRLIPYLVSNPKDELIAGYCGIPEPDSNRLTEIAPDQLDIVLVPGSVFDRQGGRLGYGGGYYDRFLASQAPQALRVGLAYEMQVVEQVPTMDHDIPLQYLITEKEITRISK